MSEEPSTSLTLSRSVFQERLKVLEYKVLLVFHEPVLSLVYVKFVTGYVGYTYVGDNGPMLSTRKGNLNGFSHF